jgi:hypothetical protein
MSEATPSSGKYPPKSRVRRAAPVAVTLVQSVSGKVAAAFQNFLITKHLERSPAPVTPVPTKNTQSSLDDEIPF